MPFSTFSLAPTVSGPALDERFASLGPDIAVVLQELRLPTPAQIQQNPRLPGAAATAGLLRLLRIAHAWPGMFGEVLRYQPRPQILDDLARARGFAIGARRFTEGGLGEARLLLELARVQRAFAVQLLAGNPKERVDPGSHLIIDLPQPFVNAATVERGGLPSVSALEYRLRNIAPKQYAAVLQQAGLEPLEGDARRAMDKVMVDAGFLKQAIYLWELMPIEARQHLLDITRALPEFQARAPLPRPWYVYQPDPDANALEAATRLLTIVEQARTAAEAWFRERAPVASVVSIPLWQLPFLTGFEPPAAIKSAFRDPNGPGGYLPTETFLALIMKARALAAAAKRGSRSVGVTPGTPAGDQFLAPTIRTPREQLTLLAQRYTAEGVRWLIEGTPSFTVFDQAFAAANATVTAYSFSRVISRPIDYFDVIVYPWNLIMCRGGSILLEPAQAPRVMSTAPGFGPPPGMPPGLPPGPPMVPPVVPPSLPPPPPSRPPTQPPTRVPPHVPTRIPRRVPPAVPVQRVPSPVPTQRVPRRIPVEPVVREPQLAPGVVRQPPAPPPTSRILDPRRDTPGEEPIVRWPGRPEGTLPPVEPGLGPRRPTTEQVVLPPSGMLPPTTRRPTTEQVVLPPSGMLPPTMVEPRLAPPRATPLPNGKVRLAPQPDRDETVDLDRSVRPIRPPATTDSPIIRLTGPGQPITAPTYAGAPYSSAVRPGTTFAGPLPNASFSSGITPGLPPGISPAGFSPAGTPTGAAMTAPQRDVPASFVSADGTVRRAVTDF